MPAKLPASERRTTKAYTLSASAVRAVERFAAELGVPASRAVELAIEAFAREPHGLGMGESAVLADPRGGFLRIHRVPDLDWKDPK
jgi:hypothetical protein